MSGGPVDRERLTGLLTEVGPVATGGMLDRFVDMMAGRVSRLRHAVATGEELLDVTLSLACSAEMLGAHALADAATRCRTEEGAGAERALAEVEALAGPTCHALRGARAALSGR
jgi:HPt (histidine-containing phosphotransfer) domain-containing protein